MPPYHQNFGHKLVTMTHKHHHRHHILYHNSLRSENVFDLLKSLSRCVARGDCNKRFKSVKLTGSSLVLRKAVSRHVSAWIRWWNRHRRRQTRLQARLALCVAQMLASTHCMLCVSCEQLWLNVAIAVHNRWANLCGRRAWCGNSIAAA